MAESADSVRAFFAIDLDDRVRSAAAAVADRLRECPAGDAVRWVREETFHVTLRFLGDIDSGRIARLAGCVREQTAALSPFLLQLGGARLFPSRRRALAAAHLQWQRDYDWDLLKVGPASSYAVVDWGVEDRWVGHI